MACLKKTPLLQAAAFATLALCLCAPVMAQKKPALDAQAKSASVFETIPGSPLQVRVGDNQSFQVFNSAIPGTGQFYPSGATDTGDMGWIIHAGGTSYGPTLDAGDSYTAYSGMSVSAVSGSGTTASPYQVTVDGTLGATGITARQVVSYINGDNYYSMQMTLTNGGATSQDTRLFLAGDIYLADADSGIPTRQGSSPGGSDCGATPSYHILFIPQTPADGWSGSDYSSIWSQVTGGALDNALATGCIDNGAALQWNRTIAAGGSVTVSASVSFGDIPDIVDPGPGPGPGQGVVANVPATNGLNLLLMLLAMAGVGGLILRRR